MCIWYSISVHRYSRICWFQCRCRGESPTPSDRPVGKRLRSFVFNNRISFVFFLASLLFFFFLIFFCLLSISFFFRVRTWNSLAEFPFSFLFPFPSLFLSFWFLVFRTMPKLWLSRWFVKVILRFFVIWDCSVTASFFFGLDVGVLPQSDWLRILWMCCVSFFRSSLLFSQRIPYAVIWNEMFSSCSRSVYILVVVVVKYRMCFFFSCTKTLPLGIRFRTRNLSWDLPVVLSSGIDVFILLHFRSYFLIMIPYWIFRLQELLI